MNDDCAFYNTGDYVAGGPDDEFRFSWWGLGGSLLTWFVVYWCVFKGVKSSSYVVWVTVPLPVLFVFLMVLRGLTLENSDEGIRMYLLGEGFPCEEGADCTWKGKLLNPEIWTESCAQIFFSIGVCMGVMTSYASYNPVDKPIIGDACKVAFGNSLFSFFAGFAVFSVAGYLKHLNSPVQQVTSISLAFISYPTAMDTMPGANFWACLFALTLFTLGIDSAFSLVEASSTVIADTETGKKMPRKLVALILCVVGAFSSLLFTHNWGFTYFDCVDHYLANYLFLIVGILQCFGSCWIYKMTEAKQAASAASVWVLVGGYWGAMLVLGFLGNFIDSQWALPVSAVAFWVWMLIVWGISFALSGLGFREWYNKIFFWGANDLAISMTNLSHEPGENPWWVGVFEFWWSFSMKYFFSWAVFWLLMIYFRNDIPLKEGETMYSGYHGFWQFMGALYPVGGIVIFILGAVFCTTREDFDHDVDKALAGIRQDDTKGVETKRPLSSNKVSGAEETELGAINS